MTNRTFSILLFLLSCCSISFIGTTIWLLLERNENESCSVDGFLHQGKHGQIKLSRNGNLELMNDQKWTVYVSLGSHVKNASPVSCSERDFCLGKFSRLLIKSKGRPEKVRGTCVAVEPVVSASFLRVYVTMRIRELGCLTELRNHT